MSWRNVQLSDLLDEGGIEIQTGPFGTQLKASDYTPAGTPVINVRNIGYGDLRPDKLEYVPDQVVSRLSRHLLETKDIVFGRKGAVDRHLLVKEAESGWMQGSDCIRLRIITDEIIPAYLSYALRLTNHRQWMITQCSNKATMASLNQDVVGRISINLPGRAIQAEITSILSAYDDLIENNRRRIQLLEQAARLLYKEWFVHLRFPGHEHVKIKDGVPEGWEKKTAFDVMDVLSGGTPRTNIPDYWDGGIPFFTPKDATDYAYVSGTEKTLTESGLKNCSSKLYSKDTVFITARGTVGKVNLAQIPMAMNQSCYALVAKPLINQLYLYFALVDGVEQFRSRAVGAVFDAIIRDTFKLIPFVVPDSKYIKAFTEHATPILRQIDVLSNETRKLIQARDLLLPRLMNGEVII
jgi:type I restriction enzyme, S subunit